MFASIIIVMYTEDLISEFCLKQSDRLYSADTRRRKSILLQIRDDMDYNLGIHKSFKVLGLNQEQEKILGTRLAPLFVVPLLYCSAIDLMGRIQIKNSKPTINAAVFKDSAQLFFNYTLAEADILWNFRNSVTHQYSINKYIISRYGDGNKVLDIKNDRIVISVRPMRGSLLGAIQTFNTLLLGESNTEKALTANFLNKHGFTYYLVD